MTCGDVSTCFAIDAAGNFIVPLSAMSYNAYKTVIDIDTLGTFNCSKAVFDKWFKVGSAIILRVFLCLSLLYGAFHKSATVFSVIFNTVHVFFIYCASKLHVFQ